MTGKTKTRKTTRTRGSLQRKSGGKLAWKDPFLKVLAKRGNISEACETVGIVRSTAYATKEKDPKFRDAWSEALVIAADRLERIADERATEGVEKPLVSKGQVVFAWFDKDGNIVAGEKNQAGETVGVHYGPVMLREVSDTLLITLLKAHRPEKYRDRYEVRNLPAADVDETIGKLADELEARLRAVSGNGHRVLEAEVVERDG